MLFTLFNLAQFLGYVEVVRREGPREDAFLQAGNPQGSDTLATLVEGLRFVMSAASGNLVVSVIPGQIDSRLCWNCCKLWSGSTVYVSECISEKFSSLWSQERQTEVCHLNPLVCIVPSCEAGGNGGEA